MYLKSTQFFNSLMLFLSVVVAISECRDKVPYCRAIKHRCKDKVIGGSMRYHCSKTCLQCGGRNELKIKLMEDYKQHVIS